MGSARTDPKTGRTTITLPWGEKYAIHAEAHCYFGLSENIDLTADSLREYQEIERNLYMVYLDTEVVDIKLNIFFDKDSAILKPESFPDLNRAIKLFNDYPSCIIQEISGYTCDLGSPAHNLDLSKRRADAVKMYLIEKGIDIMKIKKVKGYGQKNPICTDENPTEECREKNRRVEIRVIKKGGCNEKYSQH
jgi:outer membrane protein OmpA-like peptidoglycan-associated protein